MSGIEWERWHDEITQLYVTEHRSAEETIKTLNQRHKLRITSIKQFKKRYSGLKKVSATEWRAIKREMQKQKAAGKECLLFLNGRQLGPDRVAREMRRYSGIRGRDVEDGGAPFDIGINTTGQHRLELRTNILRESGISSDIGSSILRCPSPADVTRIIGSCGPNLANANSSPTKMYSLDFDWSDMSMSNPCFTELLSEKSPRDTLPIENIPPRRSGQGVIDGNSEGTTSAFSQRPCPTPECFIPDFSLFDPSIALKPRFKIPQRFLRILRGITLNVSQANHFKRVLEKEIGTFASIINSVQHPAWRQKRHSGYGWVTMASVDPSLHILKPIYYIAEHILREGYTSLDYDNNAAAKDCQATICRDQRLLNLFFSVILHLICNNIASDNAVPSLLEWATEMNVLDQLAIFLRRNSGDAETLLEAAVRRLNRHLYQDTETSPEEPKTWWEKLLDLLDNKGLRVSREVTSLFLHAIARTSAVSCAGILLDHGADINVNAPIRNIGHSRTPISPLGPPLFVAICSRSFEMAEFLIEKGSEIDRCYQVDPPELSCNALSISISEQFPQVANLLLQKGAQIPPSIKIDSRLLKVPLRLGFHDGMYPFLRQWILRHRPPIDLVVQAASISKTELFKILQKHNILQGAALECALRRAVETEDTLAVQTLLQRGVNPNPPPCQIECSRILGIDEDIVGVAPICLSNNASDEGRNITWLLLRAGSIVPDHVLIDIFRWEGGNTAVPLYTLLESRGLATPVIGASALVNAVTHKSLTSCSHLLDLKAPVNYYGTNRMSCLQQAASQGDMLLTRFLLEHGADVNFDAHEDRGRTALQSAVEYGASAVVECLLGAGADIQAAPAKNDGVTILEALAKCDLFSSHAGNGVGSFWGSPEYQVLKLDRFRNWVAMGAPINRPNRDDSSLLHYLVLRFHRGCLELALGLGARIEDRCRVHKYGVHYECLEGTKTPLQLAAYLDEMEAARLLLRHGADTNAHPSDEYGRTALQAATCNSEGRCGHEMLQLLFSFNADINAPPARIGGLTALQAAAISGDLSIAKMLLERGADINAPAAAEKGRTAIEGAAEHGRLDMVEFLLENGAKGDPETGFSSAIELAEAEVHLGVAKVLREHVAMSALLDLDLAHGAGGDLVGHLPSPGFVVSDEAIADFNFEMPS
ncbi:hypothetical protein CLIM01_06522 [Colletotrichum limetticola]|uniref:Clr5 domain-containing protein n=1 Tax=Colletotrichum limetticola TaxID=1209924 RepID=A0ABQ9PX45_9PEZI|nr:hypothetical protein CLIM01_06522 [Colletotrichum limetticola]